MKKILYVVDYLLDEYNSVRDAIYNIATSSQLKEYEVVLVRQDGLNYNPLVCGEAYGIKYYKTQKLSFGQILKSKNLSIFKKLSSIYKRCVYKFISLFKKNTNGENVANEKYLDKIIKTENPDLIMFMAYSPKKVNAELCIKYSKPYLYMLYDTFITRPGEDLLKAKKLEEYVINNSCGYFIPHFFIDDYLKNYNNDKIIKYNYPLLVGQKEVENAYYNTDKKYEFVYFGQIQPFRNGDKIKEVCKKLNICLNVFTTKPLESDETFKVFPAITQQELYNTVAGSKYLVAIDNGAPFENYLPSKVYLYASFTKPIIIFGDNKDSATIRFFKDYPNCYYQNVNEPLDGLKEFLNKDILDKFDIEIYKKYLEYLPQNAVKVISDKIDEILN